MNKQTFTEYQLCARASHAILVALFEANTVCTDAGNRGREGRGKLGKFSRLISMKGGFWDIWHQIVINSTNYTLILNQLWWVNWSYSGSMVKDAAAVVSVSLKCVCMFL